MQINIDQALTLGQQQLKESDSPYLDARLILEYVIQADHSHLIAHPDEELDQSEFMVYRELLHRAAQCEPIPYLIGTAPFYGNEFIVTPAVLIPRPETELLVDSAIDWACEIINKNEIFSIVDVGTGSGCVAITLATILEETEIAAVDISADALQVARQNAIKHGVHDRINFLQGDLLGPINFNPNLIVANLPYVADDEWSMLDRSVRLFEPEIALRGGGGGIERLNRLLRQAKKRLAPGGGIFLEIGWRQGSMVLEVAASLFPRATIRVKTDLSDQDRIIMIDTVYED